jgi:hypothetical protein
MKKVAMFAALMTMASLTAFAATKAEREYMKNTVVPAVKAAEAAYKASCGCALKIIVAASIKTEDDMYQVKHVSESISSSAEGYCTDEESKKAVCQMKTLEISKGKETAFTFKGGKGMSVTDGQSYMPWDNMMRELDK